MANFNVSLKKLTEKVSLDVVYTPKGLEEIKSRLRRSTARPVLAGTMITLISSGCRSWVWPR